MPALDIFSNDAFSLSSLTAAINNVPYKPGRLGAAGLFEEAGVTQPNVFVESYEGVLSLVPVVPRNAPAAPLNKGNRKALSFRVPHVPTKDALAADEVLGVRAFGSENELEGIQNVVNGRLLSMRNNLEYTLEAHRVACLKGEYIDASGAAISLYTAFDVVQQVINFALNSDTTLVRSKCLDVLEAIEPALGGLGFSGVRVFCGSTFWRSLIEHKAVKETYLNTQMAASLRGDARMEMEFGGLVFERYRGAGSVAIGDKEAYAVPIEVSGLFITRFAPANYIETVNTLGLPIYAKQEPMDMGKGIDLEAQSNPLNLCTRPRAIIKLTTP
ncbi:MAG: hypothetical protein BWY57_01612 [Betaproteobacteria bacterium ADurb.Bin341]|nr:MAG: hypothetical protein BWY57_01612 [Betaproteobacteria bacterium ADurb.Bin341]